MRRSCKGEATITGAIDTKNYLQPIDEDQPLQLSQMNVGNVTGETATKNVLPMKEEDDKSKSTSQFLVELALQDVRLCHHTRNIR